eukprot:c24681_g1_i2 orf=536-1024(+)
MGSTVLRMPAEDARQQILAQNPSLNVEIVPYGEMRKVISDGQNTVRLWLDTDGLVLVVEDLGESFITQTVKPTENLVQQQTKPHQPTLSKVEGISITPIDGGDESPTHTHGRRVSLKHKIKHLADVIQCELWNAHYHIHDRITQQISLPKTEAIDKLKRMMK